MPFNPESHSIIFEQELPAYQSLGEFAFTPDFPYQPDPAPMLESAATADEALSVEQPADAPTVEVLPAELEELIAPVEDKFEDTLSEDEYVQEVRHRIAIIAGKNAAQCAGELLPDANRHGRKLLHVSVGRIAADKAILVVTDDKPEWEVDEERPQSVLLEADDTAPETLDKTAEETGEALVTADGEALDFAAIMRQLENHGRGGQMLDEFGNGRHVTVVKDENGNPLIKHVWTITNADFTQAA